MGLSGINTSGPRRPGDPGYTSKVSQGSEGSYNPEGAASTESGAQSTGVQGPAAAQRISQAAPVKAPETPTGPASRKLGPDDIVNILIGQQRSPTPQNKNIVFTLLKHGLEASSQNMDAISRLLQGKEGQANIVESSVVSVLKGVSNSPKTVDIVGKFLNNQISTSQSLTQIQTSLQQFLQAFQSYKIALAPGLYTGVTNIISQIEKNLKKLEQKNAEGELHLALVNQGKVIQDFHLFAGLLVGLGEHLQQKNMNLIEDFQNPLKMIKGSIGKFIESLASQSILSKENNQRNIGQDEFSYWQIPNPFSDKKSATEILIKRDSDRHNEKRKFDPEKTKIVVKCETEDIGELSIIVEISGKKVWYIFYTENPETKQNILLKSAELKEQLAGMNYELVGLKTQPQKLNIKRMLLPTINLDKLSRINTQA